MDSRTRELGEKPIRKLLPAYAIPAIVSTTATSLYNVIDRIFIGQGVGASALAGLGLTLPIMNLSTAFGILVGAGAAALASIRIGEKRKEDATKILCNALILSIAISIIFTCVTLSALDPILRLFGADAETLPYARSFLQIILGGNVITQLLFGLNSIMRATGYPVKSMLSILITVGCNLILAPLFIFVFHWGIRGAAWATILSQLAGMSWVVAHFISTRSLIHFEKAGMQVEWKLVGNIFAIGLSPFIIHICTCLVTLVMNWKLKEYGGNTAIATYGIIISIQSLIITIILGLSHGMQPIVGYNFGARQLQRTNRAYVLTIVIATTICTVCFAIVMSFPHTIAKFFTQDEAVVALIAKAIRLCCAALPIIGFQVVTSHFFQYINRAKVSVFLSLSRQIIFLLPFIAILPSFYGLDGAWYAIPAADVCATCVTAGILVYEIRAVRE